MRWVALALLAAGCAVTEISYPSGAWPIVSEFRSMTNPNGSRRPYPHGGIDISAPRGTEVVAVTRGVVEEVVRGDRVGGNMIFQEVTDGVTKYQLRYAHLDEILVTAGEVIEKGQVIGKVGNSGEWVSLNEAPHLHFAVIRGGRREDPENYLKNQEGRVDCTGAGRAWFRYPVACTRP